MTSSEFASPQWLEEKFCEIEKKLGQSAHNQFVLSKIFGWLCWSAWAYFILWRGDLAPWFFKANPLGSWILITHSKAILILWFSALLRPNIKIPDFVLVLFTLLTYFSKFTLAEDLFLLGFFVITFAPLICLSKFPKRFSQKMRLILGLAFSVTTFIVIHTYFQLHPSANIFRIERVFMIFSFAVLANGTLANMPWTYWFKVTDIVYPLPHLRNSQSAKPLSELKVAPALLAIVLASFVAPNPLEDFFSVSLKSYSYYYLNSWGAVVAVVALARAHGWTDLKAFQYPLLATTPADCWARWNLPFYQWLKLMVFNPTYRSSKNLTIAVILTFFVSYLLHDFQSIVSYIYIGNPESYSLLKNKFYFFAFQAASVAISLPLASRIPSSKSRKSWIFVVGTWVIMAMIHWWVRWT